MASGAVSLINQILDTRSGWCFFAGRGFGMRTAAFTLFAVVAIVAVLIIIGSFSSNQPGGIAYEARTSAATFCNGSPDKAAQAISIGKDVGALPSGVTGGRIEVDEHVWAELPRKSKITLTLALYCGVADRDGRGHVMLVGYRDGDTKASMTDGNYLD